MRRLPPGGRPGRYARLSVTPVGVTIGAEIAGVDLREPLADDVAAELDTALHEWKVLFLRDQHLTADQHAAFASRWGEMSDDQLRSVTRPDPVDNLVVFTRDAETVGLENGWHSDGTFRAMPTRATVLRAIEVPDVGGDTLFADMAAAYDNLPDGVRARLRGLTARHDWSLGAYAAKYGDQLDEYRRALPPVEHPVVIRHPVTGRATLFVNPMFTREVVGLDPAASDELLELLFAQADLPELQARMRWLPGSIAFWDNIAVQHYGANDYHPARRVMARATVFSRTHTHLSAAE
jgi:taurine dioxygenase